MWNYATLEDVNPLSCLNSLQRKAFDKAAAGDASSLVRSFLKLNLQLAENVLSDREKRHFKLLVPGAILDECFNQYLWLISALHVQAAPDREVENLPCGRHFVRVRIYTMGNPSLPVYCILNKIQSRRTGSIGYWLEGLGHGGMCSHVTPKNIEELRQYQVEILPQGCRPSLTPLSQHTIMGNFPPPSSGTHQERLFFDVTKKIVIVDARKNAIERLKKTDYLSYFSAGEINGKGVLVEHHSDRDVPNSIGVYVVNHVCNKGDSSSSLECLLKLYPDTDFIVLTHKQTDFPCWMKPNQNQRIHAIIQLAEVEDLLDFTKRQEFGTESDECHFWAWDPWSLAGLLSTAGSITDTFLEKYLSGYRQHILDEKMMVVSECAEEIPGALEYDKAVNDLAERINEVRKESADNRLGRSLCRLYLCVVNPDADDKALESAVTECEKCSKRQGLDAGNYAKWRELRQAHPKRQIIDFVEKSGTGAGRKVFRNFRISSRSPEMKEYCESLNKPRLLILTEAEKTRMTSGLTGYKRCFSSGVFSLDMKAKLLPGLKQEGGRGVAGHSDIIPGSYDPVDDLDKWLVEIADQQWADITQPGSNGEALVLVSMIIDCGVAGRIYAGKNFKAHVIDDEGEIIKTSEPQERDKLLIPKNQNGDVFQYVIERARMRFPDQYGLVHRWHQPFADYCKDYMQDGRSKSELLDHLRKQGLDVTDVTINGWLNGGDTLAPGEKRHLEVIAKITEASELQHAAGEISKEAQALRNRHQQLGRKLASEIRNARVTGNTQIKIDDVCFNDIFDRFTEVTVEAVSDAGDIEIRSSLINRLLTLEDLDENDT